MIALHRYCSLLVDLHFAILRYGNDSPEADAIRDTMDAPGSCLGQSGIHMAKRLVAALEEIMPTPETEHVTTRKGER